MSPTSQWKKRKEKRWKENWLKLNAYIQKIAEKNHEKTNPLENTKMKNTFYVIAVISLLYLDFWGNKKFSTTHVNWKSGLNETHFLVTIY